MKRAFKMAAIAALLLGLLLSGCASTKYTQNGERVKAMKGVAVVVDVTMTRGRTMKADSLSLAENQDSARKVAERAAALLQEKGYAVAGGPAYTVGLSGTGVRDIEVLNDADAEGVEKPPFLIGPAGAMKKEEAALLYRKAEEELMLSESSPYGDAPVLVVSAGGRYISGGSAAGNVGKAAANTVIVSVVVVAAAFGGNVNNVPLMEMDKDVAWLTFRLFDPVTGSLIWKDVYKDTDNPESGNFIRQLENMIKKLPAAEGGRG